jgi:hypothetical protein
MKENPINRRTFLGTAGTAMAGAMLYNPVASISSPSQKSAKTRVVLVGTGIRGSTFWGKNLVENYGDILEFAGLCDINPGRLEFAKNYIGVTCPVFTDFDENDEKYEARNRDRHHCRRYPS